jgi:hypothetical protein
MSSFLRQDSTKSGKRRLISSERAAFLSRSSLSVMLGIEFHLSSSQGRSGFGPAWLRNSISFDWPGAKLRRKWPANYLIWYHCVETPLTPDAFYRLADHPLCNPNSGGNMNLLLGFTVLAFPRSPRCNARRSPSLFLRAAYFITRGARIPGARFNFRIGGNGAAVHRHFLWSFSCLRFRSRTFHNASRKFFGLQLSSLAFAFALAPARDSLHSKIGRQFRRRSGDWLRTDYGLAWQKFAATASSMLVSMLTPLFRSNSARGGHQQAGRMPNPVSSFSLS